ncbi:MULTISPECIES: flagellar hook-associated protein FlgK [Paracoccus]|uniref:flagellar hook-associated protein FlgK n=1 Tax=Paracoccus TaxID=265 RepID=UPI000868C468|nr:MULTISPECIES: flagellar hook-associated protein FlgK [Paracoccus]ODT61119.1 MAG: flagellar hook-associated protein FlgK [Paracoccus sp. SCN 68-21]
MSIAKAISNAMSGLTATARGTEVVASNLSNIMTPGYARREMVVTAQLLGGGVRIDGITRIVNASLLSEARMAASSVGDVSARASFFQGMEKIVGLPGEPQALSTALTDFQAALSAAAARPDDEIRLSQIVSTASALAGRLNAASTAVQAARSTAQQDIASEVATVNAALERVAYLNARITVLDADGKDATPLMDERQQQIDRIARIVPVQEVTREGGKVALFTAEGAVLLDGSVPARLGVQGNAQVTAGQVVGAPLELLTLNGTALSAAQMRLFGGGSLAANFQIRDQLGPQLQSELDDMAFELHQRLADPAVDPTLGAGDAGLFTDVGARADPATLVGLAGRIALNASVDPGQGGQLWRLRSGLQAPNGEPVGQSSVLNALVDALDAQRPAQPGSGFTGNGSLSSRFGSVESRVATRRVEAQADLAVRSSRQSTLSASMMAEGVDSDAEMQRLLQYEQSFAANARVLSAVDEMINQILRI